MQEMPKDIQPEETHLKDYLDVLRRRRLAVLLCFLSVVLAVAAYTLGVYPTYESTATIMLDENNKDMGIPFLGLGEVSQTQEKLNTQVKVLQSRTVAENAVKRVGLRLQVQPEERMYNLLLKHLTSGPANGKPPAAPSGIRLTGVRVDEGAPAGEYTATFEDDRRFAVTDDTGAVIGKGEIGQPFSGRGVAFVASGSVGPGKHFRFTVVPLSSAAGALGSSMRVSPVRNSKLIEIKVTWNNAAMARDIGDAVIAAYKDLMVSKRTREASQVLAFVEDQTKDVEKGLVKAEDNLRKFKEKQGIVALDADVQAALAQVAAYERDYRTAQNYRKQAEIVLAAIQAPGPFSEKEALFSLGAGLNSNLLVNLGTALSDLTARRSALLSSLKEQHPRVIEVTRQIEDVKQRITAELSSLLNTLKVSERDQQANLRRYEDKIRQLPSAEKELFGLLRMTKVGQDMNAFLLQKRAEMSVTKASELGNFWVVDAASAPGGPAKPRLLLNALLAVVIGGMLSVGLAFFLDYLDTSVKTPEQLTQITRLPFLGTVFHVTQNGQPADRPVVLADPRSPATEAFLAVRTNLLFTFLGDEKKLIVVTSSVPAEGKTFVTANLGVVLAQQGKRVLMVEGDLRKPGLSKVFRLERSPGLTSVLVSGTIESGALPVLSTSLAGLDIIPSGDLPPNPTDLLGSERMRRFLATARDLYDVVLIDTPPALGFSDALVLGGQAEGVIFVTRSGEVQRDILKEAIERFASVDTKLLGIVLNDVQPFDSRHYGYRYKYYAYYESDGKRIKKKRRLHPSKSRHGAD
jgi:capsular exopolysaccharide synthesis family protein